MNEHPGFDVTIVGGGIMGSSSAYHLTKMNPALKVAVRDKCALVLNAAKVA